MSKRKQISRRTRFEIFKRDQFTCQYCGKKPPLTILHVDHILPVSKGGGFENENLATSCADCNLGKSNISLQSVSESIQDRLRIERERMDQMKLYNKWLAEIKKAKDADFSLVSAALVEACGENPNDQVIAGPWAKTVRCLLGRMPAQQIVEAVQIAGDKFSFKYSRFNTFKYFCGVCWRMIGRAEGTQP